MAEVFSSLAYGFSVALTPANLIWAMVGSVIGTLIGVLPGIGPVSGIAILIPVIYGMNPASAMIMLTAMYYGTMYGGSTTSILVNVPGEASSVVTTLDGYQMARQGRAGAALAIAAIGSFVSGTLSILGLMLFAVPLTTLALKFGPAEYFGLMLLGLSSVTSLAGKSLVKALLSMIFGLMIATIGVDLSTGIARYTFEVPQLLDGIGFLVVAIGLFAVSEVLLAIEELGQARREPIPLGRVWLSWREFAASWWAMIRGTVIGFYIGVLPAAGATIASFISYDVEKRLAKDPSTFGKGDIRGVAAPESANNAAAVGNMVPLMTLGIPGSSTTAIMLGALMMLGVQPGPLMYQKNPDVFWGLIASMYIGNTMLLILNLPLVGLWVKILAIPERILYPLILAVSVIGVYGVSSSTTDLLLACGFGLLGYYMRKHDYPLAPAVLGVVLGGLMEQSLRQALVLSDGSYWILLQRPISLVLVVLSVVSLVSPYLIVAFRKFQGEPQF
ncbi:MAG: tripartite tricarboxylate transporter TctA [candidate division NC10 bacterium RIFCSPLOWO2_12_FULL_66_18]|nr:MAG: tripartite tricarboxylate transporter TctA [candidate division NC10 bacterium RIFCSPLOWO2_12_FULL_66_18]